MSRSGSVVQRREDAWRTTFFDQVADDFIVKIFNRSPFDLLANIFFLFSL